MKRIFSGVTDMKRVLILNGEGAALEKHCNPKCSWIFRVHCNYVQYRQTAGLLWCIRRKAIFNYDYLIIGCHGDGGKIIVPILGENVYYPNECRNNIGYEELQGSVKIKDKTVICTGCTTGAGDLCKAFNRNNNIFVAPADYIEGNSSLLFIVSLFYHLSNGSSFKDSFAGANSIDSETQLYNFYSWYFYYKDGKFRFTSSGGVSPKLLNHKPPCAEPTVLSVNGFPSKLQQTFSTSE